MNNAIILAARLLLAQIFVLAGFGKLGSDYAETLSYMQGFSVPGGLLPLVIILEIGGGLALILGLFTRWTALALAVFSVVAALIFHRNFADHMEMVLFLKNLTTSGGLLLLYVNGAGAISLDAKRAAVAPSALLAR